MTFSSALATLSPVGLTLDLVGAAYLSLRFLEDPGEVIDRTVSWWPTVQGQQWVQSAQPIHTKALRSEVQNVLRARVGVVHLAIGFTFQLVATVAQPGELPMSPLSASVGCLIVAIGAVLASRRYLSTQVPQFFHAALESEISDNIIPRQNWLNIHGSSDWKRSKVVDLLGELLAPTDEE